MASLVMQEEKIKSGTGREWGKWFWDTSLIPYAKRGKERSKTFQGIADAMANQWG
jgi:TM2 domain-containing membrane protein YozV